jgi:4-aminobutyrate aminotransferase-like enzyme
MLVNRIIYNDYYFEISKAKGDFIWDKKGKKYIDFTSGWNVTNLGWNNPEITQAVVSQVKKNSYASMWTPDPIQIEYAKLLTNSLPKELKALGKATGGTEANDEAIKTARAFTKRKKILGFKNTYHGQSYSTLSLGNSQKDLKDISPVGTGFVLIDFPNRNQKNKSEKEILSIFAAKLEKILKKRDIAAIVAEAGIITGWGSTYVAPDGFLSTVRKLTKKYGTLLILDEVGTGFSRCGKLFGMEFEKVIPDIATFAKGISNGAGSIGAMVTTKEIADKTLEKTTLISTFGFTPLACAAAKKTLEIHLRDKIWLKAAKDGKYLLAVLEKELKDNKFVEDIRGKGMMVGLCMKTQKFAEKVVNESLKNGLQIIRGSEGNIQLMPPLTISRKNLDKGIKILVKMVKKIK